MEQEKPSEEKPIFDVEDVPARLQWEDKIAEFRCKIWIDRDGSAHWQSQPFTRTPEHTWLFPGKLPESEVATRIKFTASVPECGKFASDYAYISRHNFGAEIAIGGGFSQGTITYQEMPEDTCDLCVAYRVAGMRGFRVQSIESPVGTISQRGNSELENYDFLSGFVSITAPPEPKPAEAWLRECDDMACKIFDLLSLAQGKFFRWKIKQIGRGEQTIRTEFLSSVSSGEPQWAAFSYLNLHPALDLAVNKYSDELCKATGLPVALEWFVHHPQYIELKVTSLVTALEHLVSVEGQDKKEPKHIPKHKYKVLRKKFEAIIKATAENEPPEERAGLEILERKLGGLNSITLRDKIDLYLAHYKIPLIRIEPEAIYEAIDARNSVIHRGHYDATKSETRLWRHASILHELVLRIILTHLGYQGQYASFLDGFKWRNFPPSEDDEVKPQKNKDEALVTPPDSAEPKPEFSV